jgi:hypothetical protein
MPSDCRQSRFDSSGASDDYLLRGCRSCDLSRMHWSERIATTPDALLYAAATHPPLRNPWLPDSSLSTPSGPASIDIVESEVVSPPGKEQVSQSMPASSAPRDEGLCVVHLTSFPQSFVYASKETELKGRRASSICSFRDTGSVVHKSIDQAGCYVRLHYPELHRTKDKVDMR